VSAPVVLVSGATGGIGSAIVRRFATSGWQVAATDLDRQRLEALDASGIVARVPGDVRGAEACRAIVGQAAAITGRIDAVVNAAGVWREGPVEACSEADFDLVVDVNLKGTFFLCAAAIPHLKRTQGCIVNISSDAGRQGNTGAAAYCASKGGVTIFTRALALELAPAGVRANVVSPGDVETPMLRFQAEAYGGGQPEAYLRGLLDKYPQGARARFIQPAEIAELVFFLCTPSAAAITGADLAIDQGYSAGK
jgi:NAD(P)-dependent dehydrogenase (short-subunit alcohol dehydrogenase family)